MTHFETTLRPWLFVLVGMAIILAVAIIDLIRFL